MSEQKKLDPDPYAPLKSSLVFGSYTGGAGLVVGSIGGVIRSRHPILFALLSGGQWFALGSTYWLSRTALLRAWPDERRREASTLAGAISGGAVAGITRNRANVLPAAFMFGLFGYLGQYGYERLDASHAAKIQRPDQDRVQSILNKIGKSKWSPIKKLDDKEYEQLMRDKILKVDVELAMIEEDIAELRKKQKSAPKDNASS